MVVMTPSYHVIWESEVHRHPAGVALPLPEHITKSSENLKIIALILHSEVIIPKRRRSPLTWGINQLAEELSTITTMSQRGTTLLLLRFAKASTNKAL